MIKWNNIEVCDCMCHREGVQIMHMVACCKLCYDTYLTKEGEVMPEKLEPLLKEDMMQSMQRHLDESLKKQFKYKKLFKPGAAIKNGGHETDNMTEEEIEEYKKDCWEAINDLNKDKFPNG